MYENQVCKWSGVFGNDAHQQDMRIRLIDIMGIDRWSVRKMAKVIIISESTLSKFIKGKSVARGVLARIQSFVTLNEKIEKQ